MNSTNLFVSTQNSSSLSGVGDYSIVNFVLSNSLSFMKFCPWSVTGSLGYTINSSDSSANIVSLDLGNSYTIFNIWNNILGINYTLEEEKKQQSKNLLHVFDSFVELSNVYFSRLRRVSRETIYRYGEYDDFLVRAIISKGW